MTAADYAMRYTSAPLNWRLCRLRPNSKVPMLAAWNAPERTPVKLMGVKRGVSDIFLAVPKEGNGGLWIEMKAQGGRVDTRHGSVIDSPPKVARSTEEAVQKWAASAFACLTRIVPPLQ